MSRLMQLVILSGKGGTGKTSVSAAFAHLASTSSPPIRAVLADVDVDAANLELVLAPKVREVHDFIGGQVAVIDPSLCARCGTCKRVCRFQAILPPSPHDLDSETAEHGGRDHPMVDPIACDGCAACMYQCPQNAIRMVPQLAGQWFRSDSRFGPLFHATLRPAQESSGKLVTLVREQARQLAWNHGYELVILDGPPGIGCPAISAATGTDLALVVTEPTVAGVHDLQRVLRTTEHFGLPTWVCINKADLNPAGTEAIERYCCQERVPVASHVPFDLSVTAAITCGLPVTVYEPEGPAALALRSLWSSMLAITRRLPQPRPDPN